MTATYRRRRKNPSRLSPSKRRSRKSVFEQLEDRRLLAIGAGNLSTGTGLTTYQLALASTAEFTEFNCNLDPICTAASTPAAKVTVTSGVLNHFVSQINLILERELAINFQLVPDNDMLIFTSENDGFTNGDQNTMKDENVTVVASTLQMDGDGELNQYDIGHVLGTRAASGGGGIAGLGVVGQAQRAEGASVDNSPSELVGDVVQTTPSFQALVAHEFGHQFGAEHSFNGVVDNCSQREADNSYEPGSGSSIMGYQGICSTDDLPVFPGDETYFHAASFDQIIRYISTEIPTLRTPTENGNNVPTINAGPDFTIPASTPFTLTATADDADTADVPTYTWDQIDLGGATGQSVPIPAGSDLVGPLFRSFAPTTSLSRTFPMLSSILDNTPQATDLNEHLSTVTRELNFRATVRDNHMVSGKTISGVASDDVKVNVVATGAPFEVTAPNSGATTWAGGSTEMVTWNEAGTTANGINTPTVNIRLSTDGGNSFPILLGNFPNNGTANVIVPNLDTETTEARVKVEGAGNIFFDVSDQNFTVSAAAAAAGVTIADTNNSTTILESTELVTDSYQISLDSVPSGNVTVRVTADAQSQISLTGAAGSFATTQDLVFNSTTPQNVFLLAIDDVAVEGNHTSTLTHAITATADMANYPTTLTVPGLVANILDDDVAPVASGSGTLVGVDFDSGADSPTNWTRIDPLNLPATTSDLIDEDGNPSTFDLLLNSTGGFFGGGSATLFASSVPMHSTPLAGVDGFLSVPGPVTMTFSDVTPGVQYDVYSMAQGNFSSPTPDQAVSIAGAGTPITFNQGTADGVLLINDETGVSTRTLESYAERVTASASGTIVITVTSNTTGKIVVPAIAIQEIVPASTITAINATNLSAAEGSGGGTTDVTFTVTRTGATPASTVDYAITGSGGNPADAADFGGALPSGTVNFQAGATTSDPVTLMVTADEDVEPDERFTVTLSSPSDGATLDAASERGTISNDDTAGTIVTLAVAPDMVAEDGTDNLVYTFTRTGGDQTQALTVNYATSGTATPDTDFTGTSASVVIPANTASATVTVDPTADTVDEPNETVILTISADAAYSIGTAAATGTITEPGSNAPVVTFTPAGPGGAPDPAPLPGTTATPTTWAIQRTSVRQIVITLPTPAAAGAGPGDLVITNLGRHGSDPNVVIPVAESQLSFSGDRMTLSIDFPASGTGALTDGRYQIELMTALTGGATSTIVGDGPAGSNTCGAGGDQACNGLFVLTGDWNGSGSVTALDFATFRYWFGQEVGTGGMAPAYVDTNDSGAVTALDFAAFKNNFGTNVDFPAARQARSTAESELVPTVTAANSSVTDSSSGQSNAATAPSALGVLGEALATGAVELDELQAVMLRVSEMVTEWDTDHDGKLTTSELLHQVNRWIDSSGPSALLALGRVAIDEVLRDADSLDEIVDGEPTEESLHGLVRLLAEHMALE